MDKCKWCNTELYKEEYYGDAAFDMEQPIEEDDYTRLSMLWNSKQINLGYTQVEKVKQLQILTTALSAEESYERSR